jgi:hypothetical protein
MSNQPKWRTVVRADHFQVSVDDTGVYEPEMEYAQELDDEGTKFKVYRFSLERMKELWADGHPYLVPMSYDLSWKYPIHMYEEWFIKSLSKIAASVGRTVEELRNDLCSDDPKHLMWVYEAIGGYHGFDNLDSYPLALTADEIDARWDR